MEIKTFELRDEATFIPIIAIRPGSHIEQERYLWSRAGFGREAEQQARYVLLSKIGATGGELYYDPNAWGDRTFAVAHQYIKDNWEELLTGQVIDVQYILGETNEPKESERFGLWSSTA